MKHREKILNREMNPDEIIKHRFSLLGYYDSSDDSGGGTALDSILQSATTLTSSYIQSQNQPSFTSPPITTQPAYGAATPFSMGGTASGSSLLFIGLLGIGLIFGVAYAFRG